MRLGIGTYALGWNIGLPGAEPSEPLDAFGVMEIAVGLGVDAVQYADNLPLETLPARELDRLEGMAKEVGIVIEPGARGISLDRLRRCIELAARFGSGFVRLVLHTEDDRPTAAEAIDRLRSLGPILDREDVALAIENHESFTARELVEIVEKLGPDRFGICLDTANSIGCQEGTRYVVETLAPYVRNVHVKDFRIDRTNHGLGFAVVGTAAGEGQLDLSWILKALPKAESATIELWPSARPDGTAPLAEEREMLRRSVAYLRGVL